MDHGPGGRGGTDGVPRGLRREPLVPEVQTGGSERWGRFIAGAVGDGWDVHVARGLRAGRARRRRHRRRNLQQQVLGAGVLELARYVISPLTWRPGRRPCFSPPRSSRRRTVESHPRSWTLQTPSPPSPSAGCVPLGTWPWLL